MKQFLLTFSLLLIFMLNLRAEAAEETCNCDPMIEEAALMALYNATDGANWATTWDLSQPVINWHGVDLDGNGCVTRLTLQSNQLNGYIPTELADLVNLTEVYLHFNQLTGNIPSELGGLINLTFLTLSNNMLTGAIPSSLGNLNLLSTLWLHNNQLTGSIPIELGNLLGLQYLH